MLFHQFFRSVIQEFPGCAYWTDNHTNDWFRRRRNKKPQQLESTNVKHELRELHDHLLPNLGIDIIPHNSFGDVGGCTTQPDRPRQEYTKSKPGSGQDLGITLS